MNDYNHLFTEENNKRSLWISDQGDGTYRNPILFADYSDPDVIRHGEDYYLVASSFNCTPGLPILHSRDLVNWTIINHALKNLPHARYGQVQPGCGVWAPALRFHDGKFWIFFPTPDEGIYVITADDPKDEWSTPHLVQAGRGLIDPCPLWDDNGRSYLTYAYAASRAGIKDRICVAPMAPDGTKLLDEGRVVFSDPARHHTIEGPKFLKKDGTYYILAPAGGVPTGWQVVLRSRHIFGPYEEKVVLAQGTTAINGPHQGALVDTPTGEWWFVHFQEWQPYGRIVHLQPVQWRDGWPLMGINQDDDDIGEPVRQYRKPDVGRTYPVTIPQTSDEFDGKTLGLQWQWYANHEDTWSSLTARSGWLRLGARPAPKSNLSSVPSLLLQKFPAPTFTVETSLELFPKHRGETAGLAVVGKVSAALVLRHNGAGYQVIFQSDGTEQVVASSVGNAVRLSVTVAMGGLCTFSYALPDGDFVAVDRPFQAQEGIWIGAKVGLFCMSPQQSAGGYADFDYFRFV